MLLRPEVEGRLVGRTVPPVGIKELGMKGGALADNWEEHLSKSGVINLRVGSTLVIEGEGDGTRVGDSSGDDKQ